MDSEQQGDIQAAIAAGRAQVAEVQLVAGADGVRMLTAPDTHSHTTIDLEPYAVHPRRQKGNVTVRNIASLVMLVKRHQSAATVLYAHDDGRIVAVFNDHESDGTAGWRDHRVMMARPVTKAFTAWRAAFERGGMTQQEFAGFLEDRLGEIAEPSGADLLEIAQEFRASRSLKFRTQRRISNGQQQVEYIEELEGGGGREGKITLPEEVTVVVAPYRDSSPITFIVRLRWSLADQAVRFTLVPVEGDRTRSDGLVVQGLQNALDDLHDTAIRDVGTATGAVIVLGAE